MWAGEPRRLLESNRNMDASYLSYDDSKCLDGYCMSLGDMGTFYTKFGEQRLVVATSYTCGSMYADDHSKR